MLGAVYRYILFHDDSKLFVFTYVGLAVVLAIWLGLFWLAVVVAGHLLIELVKQHHYDPRPLPALARSLWDLKLDIGLVLFGLVIGLYMGVILGAAGLGAAARVGAQTATRVGIWQRAVRGLLLTVDDVALVVKTRSVGNGGGAAEAAMAASGMDQAASTGSGGSAETDAVPEPPHPPSEPPAGGPDLWGGWAAPRWSRGDRLALGFTVLSALLLVAAPLLTDHTPATAWAEILRELRPFPEG